MKIAFCSTEVFPFAKTGGLGDVGGSLPLALEELGFEVTVFMPKFRCVERSGQNITQLIGGVPMATIGERTNVYFVDDAPLYDRDGLYGDTKGEYKDNLIRFGYFCDQTLKLFKALDIQPDIVHCNDWQTSLIPVLLKKKYHDDPYYKDIKTLLTIHNLAFQGVFPKEQYPKLGLDEKLFNKKIFKFQDQINLLKAGIVYSDRVTTVSPQYSKEILTKRYGCGLNHDLRRIKKPVVGILNGLDYKIWNPKKDKHISMQYSLGDYEEGKLVNKAHLQKELGLSVMNDFPLFGFVGRLSYQKGIDLILKIADDMVQLGTQMVFLGIGESQYRDKLAQLAQKYPEQVAFHDTFNEPLGHRIYAGSDFFMMPSRFEPCGISQMISLCYGTIPVCFKTGGLNDTVKPYGAFSKKGNGIMFNTYTISEFYRSIRKAVKYFNKKKQFDQMRHNAFRSVFTWTRSALQYQDLYQCV